MTAGTALSVIAVASFLAVSGGSIAKADNLSNTVQEAIHTYPEILEAAANKRAIENEMKQAEGLYLPQVDVRAAIGPEHTNNPTTRSRADREPGQDSGVWMPRREIGVTLQQRLFDGWATKSEIERQAARTDSAALRVQERSEFIALDVVQAYLDVLRNTEITELALENVESHNRILGDVRTRVDAGQSGVGDVQQTDARLAAAKANLVEANRDLEQAIITFEKLVNQKPEDLTRPQVPSGAVPGTADAAIQIALSNNPTLKLATADVDVSKAEISATKSNFWPSLSLEMQANRNANIDGVRGENNDFIAQVVMEYNIFRGGIDAHQRQEFVERLAESRARFLRLQRDTEEEVRQSWNAMTKAQEQAAVLGDQVIANGQVVSTYRQEFDIGQRDLLDLLDSENELFNSRARAVTADYVAQFGQYRLLASMGELLNTLGVKPIAESATGARDDKGITPDWRWQSNDVWGIPFAGSEETFEPVVTQQEKAITGAAAEPVDEAEQVNLATQRPIPATDLASQEPAFEPTSIDSFDITTPKK